MQGDRCIYRISCTPIGWHYIGATVDRPLRWQNHRSSLEGGRHCTRRLQDDWTTFGAEVFEFAIVELVDSAPGQPYAFSYWLQRRERYWIAQAHKLSRCYNRGIGKETCRNCGQSVRPHPRPCFVCFCEAPEVAPAILDRWRSRRRRTSRQRPPRAELEAAYLTRERSMGEIGAEYGVFASSVQRWLREYDIPTRTRSEARKLVWNHWRFADSRESA